MKSIIILVKEALKLVYIFVFSLSLFACGHEVFLSGDEENEPGSYSQENVFFEEKDMSLVLSRTDEGIIQFSKKTPLNKIPEVGKVLALPIDEEYPIGYYGKVKEISELNGAWEVQLEPATIAELYPDTVLYYKGPVYALNSSRAGDDVVCDINLSFGLVNITGVYEMVSPEVEYEVVTSNGQEIGRTFRILSRVKTETEISIVGKDIDWESKTPLATFYLVGGGFTKYLGLGIKADLDGRVVGNIDIDVSATHKMQAQMDAGFSVGDHVNDSIGKMNNKFDVVINEWKWSEFQKAKGEIGFGFSLKAYTDINIIKWKFSTDDNLFLRVAPLVNFKSDFDYANFDYKDVNNEIETGLKLIVDYKAGFMKEDVTGNEIFVGWSDSADWYYPWKTFLIWPEFQISSYQYWGNSALLSVSLIKNEAIYAFHDKALVWVDKETKRMCGYEYITFDGNYTEVVITGLDSKKEYLVYPAIEVDTNMFIRVGEPYWVGPNNLDLPDYDWILP